MTPDEWLQTVVTRAEHEDDRHMARSTLAELERLREQLAGQAPAEGSWQTEALALRAELQKWHAVGRRIVEAHREGWTPILQSDADELARLTGEAL